MKYGVRFIFGLFCEFSNLEPVWLPVMVRVHQAEYGIHILVAASQEYLKCIISRKQKACSCTPSTTGAAYAARDAWRAYGRASHALCLAVSHMGWPSYLYRVLFARAPVLGL